MSEADAGEMGQIAAVDWQGLSCMLACFASDLGAQGSIEIEIPVGVVLFGCV